MAWGANLDFALTVGLAAAIAVFGCSTSVTAQSVTEYPLPTPSSTPENIAVEADGALWFTEFHGNKIGWMTTSGTITEFGIPTSSSAPGRDSRGARRRAMVHRAVRQ
jgi:virginiamycin B lyase